MSARIEPSIDQSVKENKVGAIASASLLMIGRRFGATAAGAVATGLLAHKLSVSTFGTYSAAVGTFYLLASLCDLGFSSYLSREMAQRPYERGYLLRAATRAATVWSMGMVSVAVALAIISGTTTPRAYSLFILSAAIFTAGLGLARQHMIVILQVRSLAITDMITGFGQAAILIVLSFTGASAPALAAVISGTTIVNVIAVARLASRDLDRPNVPFRASVQVFRSSAMFGVASILSSAYFSIDLALAGLLVSAVDVAHYAAATKLISLIVVVPSILISMALPEIARRYGISDLLAVRSLTAELWQWLWTLVAPLCVLIAVFARDIVNLLFGSAYSSSIPMVQILMAAAIVSLANNLVTSLLVVMRKGLAATVQNAVALAANVGLNVVLLPQLGTISSAWITLGTEIFVVGCATRIVLSAIDVGEVARRSWGPLIAMGFIGAAGAFPMPAYFDVPMAICGYLLIMTAGRFWPQQVTQFVGEARQRVSHLRTGVTDSGPSDE